MPVEERRALFFEKLIWATDKINLVSMRTGANQVLVEYVDRTVRQQGEKEAKSKKEENWRRSTAKDASKF